MSKGDALENEGDLRYFQRVTGELLTAAERGYGTRRADLGGRLALRTVRVDDLVVDRIQIGVEPGVDAMLCSGFVGSRDEITWLIWLPARLPAVAILLTAHDFL